MKGAALVLTAMMATPVEAASPMTFKLPVQTRTLPNGLTVVVSENHDSTVVGLCVLYKIGYRLEPRKRTGFAHLFEHLMFEGTPKAPKGTFDRVCDGAGGSNNGQTRPDATIYIETFPSSALDRFLWLEADRMTSLAFSEETLKNQRDVVKEEIRVNVKNDPYGLFETSTLPAKLFDKWENAHDGYGDFKDLDAATLEDVKSFFGTFYRPNNAVLAVTGDVSPEDVFAKAERFFGAIPSAKLPPRPDLFEEKRKKPVLVVEEAPLAETPALAVGWRMPPRDHADVFPLLVASELLHEGRAGRLYRGLVEGREIATDVSGGFNPFMGNAWYDGTTMFLTKMGWKRGVPAARVLNSLSEEIAKVAREGAPQDELERVKTKLLVSTFTSLESRLDLAVELALATAFDGEADGLLAFPSRVSAVTSADVQRAVARWLTSESRAVIVKSPPAKGARR